MSEHFKGRLIDPRAYELSDGTGWTFEVYIAEDEGADTIDTRLLLKEIFSSKEVALEAGFAVGKREVEKRIRSEDIQTVIDEATHLPSTHQHGLGHSTDDVGSGVGGEPNKVPGPENPGDRCHS
jgi:hypothetical protein